VAHVDTVMSKAVDLRGKVRKGGEQLDNLLEGPRGFCARELRRHTALLVYFSSRVGLLWCVSRPLKEHGFSFSFLVDACASLKEHIHTEGLFRKSGSVVRLKALKVGTVLNYTLSVVSFPDLIFTIGIFF
jgi:hypothetical protein